jgi:hypothetical protein
MRNLSQQVNGTQFVGVIAGRKQSQEKRKCFSVVLLMLAASLPNASLQLLDTLQQLA